MIWSPFKLFPGLLCITPYLFLEKHLQMKGYLLQPLHWKKVNRKNTCKQRNGICQKGNNLFQKPVYSFFFSLHWYKITHQMTPMNKEQMPLGSLTQKFSVFCFPIWLFLRVGSHPWLVVLGKDNIPAILEGRCVLWMAHLVILMGPCGEEQVWALLSLKTIVLILMKKMFQ